MKTFIDKKKIEFENWYTLNVEKQNVGKEGLKLFFIDFIESSITEAVEADREIIKKLAKQLFHKWFGDKTVVNGYFGMDSHSVNRLGSEFFQDLSKKKETK